MGHEFDGTKYAAASAHQKEWGARLIEELALSGAERILDLGCGDGELTGRLAALVSRGSVVGLDASRGMLEAARRREAANLAFLLKDIEELDFVEEFDVIFSNATLHWIKDHDRLLLNVYRALRPGGALRFNFAAAGNCSHFNGIAREAMALPAFERAFADFRWPWFMPEIADYEALVRRLPFRDVEVWGENADRFFPDRDALVRWIDQPSLVPFLEHIGEPDRARFRESVVRRMVEETRQPDGRHFETFRRINVKARR